MVELLEAERRVAECNARIERQRRIIEESVEQAHDVTSAQIVFDSLCVSLSLYLRDRHRLRELKEDKVGTLNSAIPGRDRQFLYNRR